MERRSAGELVPAAMEGLGIFLVALLGANLMFATEAAGAGLAATLVPAAFFGAVTTLIRMPRKPLSSGRKRAFSGLIARAARIDSAR